MTSFNGDYPTLDDAAVVKNYLSKEELDTLNRIVSLYLDFAELIVKEENAKKWIKDIVPILNIKLEGYYRYYGIFDNFKALVNFTKICS